MTRLSLALMTTMLVLAPIACKQKKSSGGSKPAPSATPIPGNPYAQNPGTQPGGTMPVITIEVVGRTGTTFQNRPNEPMQLHFRINGVQTASNLITALSEMPTNPPGATLQDANTSEPKFNWTTGPEGTYYVTLLVRDRDLCQRSGVANCEISLQDYGRIQPNPAYDFSQRYTIMVSNSAQANNGGLGFPAGYPNGNGIFNPNDPNAYYPGTGFPGSQNGGNTGNGGFFGKLGSGVSAVGNWFYGIGTSIWSWISGWFN